MTANPAPAPALAGRYAIGAEIGRGSTAAVHRARDSVTGDDVAVKLFTAVTSAPGGRDRREVDILTGLRHPGLVGFRDAGTADGHLFVVMDLVEGRSLSATLRAGTLPAATVAALGAQLAEALAHVHARGVVHRDVKPANILVDERGRPRLADFGIARLDGATRMTETGVVVGTAAYMAPEQVRGLEVGPAADVYSLGLVLLEATTGQLEYPGTAVEAAIARLHRPPAVPATLPPQLALALRAMTADDPAQRPTAKRVAGLLDAVAQAAGTAPGTRRRVAERGRQAIAAAALGVLLAGIGGGWYLARPADSPAAARVANPVPVPAAVEPAPSAPSTPATVVDASDVSAAAAEVVVPAPQRPQHPAAATHPAPAPARAAAAAPAPAPAPADKGDAGSGKGKGASGKGKAKGTDGGDDKGSGNSGKGKG